MNKYLNIREEMEIINKCVGLEFELSNGKYTFYGLQNNHPYFSRETGNIVIPQESETWIYENAIDEFIDMVYEQYPNIIADCLDQLLKEQATQEMSKLADYINREFSRAGRDRLFQFRYSAPHGYGFEYECANGIIVKESKLIEDRYSVLSIRYDILEYDALKSNTLSFTNSSHEISMTSKNIHDAYADLLDTVDHVKRITLKYLNEKINENDKARVKHNEYER